MSRAIRAVAAIAVIASSFAIFASPAYAHERRTVGPYQLVVGFLTEPAFAGTANGVDLTITDTRSNKAVEGAEKTISVAITSGGLTTPLSGKVEDTDVNERFESGPGRFNDVESTTALQYPTKVPTGADLAGKLDQLQTLVIVGIVVGGLALIGAVAGLVMRRR